MARPNRFYVGIEGAKELDKFLEGMGDDAARAIDDAVQAGGNIALAKAKQYARSRIKDGTGFLESQLKMFPVVRRAGNAGTKRRITRGSVSIGWKAAAGAKSKHLVKKYGLSNPVSTYYASFVELGTKYQPKKRMIQDAIDWNRSKIAEAMKEAFLRLIRG